MGGLLELSGLQDRGNLILFGMAGLKDNILGTLLCREKLGQKTGFVVYGNA